MMSSSVSTRRPCSSRRRHVAACPFPFSSHPASMLLLCRKITAAAPGVEISLFTTEPSASALSAALSPEESRVHIRRIGGGQTASGNVVEAIRQFMESGESLRKGMVAAEEEVGVAIGCVVADSMMVFACREIAEEKGVKWVALWTPSAAGLVTHMFTDQLRKGVGPEGVLEGHKEDTVACYIPGFPSTVRIANLPHEILGVDASFPVARIFDLMSLHLPAATAVAINSFHPLEPATTALLNSTFGNKFLPSGPYALTMSAPGPAQSDPHGCLPWLDGRAPASVVYIGFGSVHAPPPEEFTSLAEALEAVRVPFLWSLPDRFKPFLPKGFEKRSEECGVGKVVPWAPQSRLLSHAAVGAHLTHCGWNSVMESVVSGVPLVCRPLGIADNMLNGRMAAREWGIGVEVEGGRMTKEATMAALERAMVGEEGKRAREKIETLKRAAEEAATDPDGSSTWNLRKFIAIITS